jgi:hypothetical protein
MAISPDLPIQAAIFDALSGDAQLTSMATGVFDQVPEKTAFPYVTIGENTLSDWGSHTFDGANAIVTIHTWARGGGRKKCKEIMGEIYRILHNGSIAIDGFSLVVLRFEFGETIKDPDGQTYHGVQRFKLLVGGN